VEPGASEWFEGTSLKVWSGDDAGANGDVRFTITLKQRARYKVGRNMAPKLPRITPNAWRDLFDPASSCDADAAR